MKAAVLKEFGSPSTVENVPEPRLGTGEVVVDVEAAGVLPCTAEVFGGERRYLLTLPVAPGAGRWAGYARWGPTRRVSVSATGSSATRRFARGTTHCPRTSRFRA